jgi:zinc D-Ala-D-Ala carboxypeptidase
MEKISGHISYNEAIHSHTAKKLGIKNIPNDIQLLNMKLIATKIFEPLREWVGGPIKINSFFRSKALNTAIKGSNTSQHILGLAIDLDDTHGFKTNKEMFHWIKENLNFDQLIWEFGNDKNPDWIHVSYVSKKANRNRCLKAERVNGKTMYSII